MKFGVIKSFSLLSFFIFSACSTFTVTEEKENYEFQESYSGTIPPFYWRWGIKGATEQLIAPFAYYCGDGSFCYTPLFGWEQTDKQNTGYYLTPIFGWSESDGIFSWEMRMLLLNGEIRLIDKEKHPEAKNSWDLQFSPFFEWKNVLEFENIRINGQKENLLEGSVGIFPSFYLYANKVYRHRIPELEFEKKIESFSLFGYGSHDERRTEGKDKASGSSVRNENSRYLLPFYYQMKVNDILYMQQKEYKYESFFYLCLPLLSHGYTEKGYKRALNRYGTMYELTEVDNDEYNFLLGLLYKWEKRGNLFQNRCLLGLLYNTQEDQDEDIWTLNILGLLLSYSQEKESSQYSFLWRLINYKSGEKGRLDLLFIPIYNNEDQQGDEKKSETSSSENKEEN